MPFLRPHSPASSSLSWARLPSGFRPVSLGTRREVGSPPLPWNLPAVVQGPTASENSYSGMPPTCGAYDQSLRTPEVQRKQEPRHNPTIHPLLFLSCIHPLLCKISLPLPSAKYKAPAMSTSREVTTGCLLKQPCWSQLDLTRDTPDALNLNRVSELESLEEVRCPTWLLLDAPSTQFTPYSGWGFYKQS